MIKSLESEELTQALEGLRQEWGFPRSFGLPQFLERWQRFVKSVEIGYKGSLDDYLQNLELRGSLQGILKRLPPAERERIATSLSAWDERFRFTTRPVDRPIVAFGDGDFFWWKRVPVRLIGQLRDELGNEELT